MSTIPESDFQRASEEDRSLRELSDAFAGAMGTRPRSDAGAEDSSLGSEGQVGGDEAGRVASRAPSVPAAAPVSPTDLPPAPVGLEYDDDPSEISPASILEGMLFVGHPAGEPLSSQRAAELMRGVTPDEIPDLVEQLNRRYTLRGCPYRIVSEGAGYRMTLRPEYGVVHNRFYGRIREARLSQVAIDVLAIVAYRQPITAEEVGQHRGRPCNPLLAQLVRRRLLRVQRDPGAPRVARYCTTDRFLSVFGLESLNDLPRSDDVDMK